MIQKYYKSTRISGADFPGELCTYKCI